MKRGEYRAAAKVPFEQFKKKKFFFWGSRRACQMSFWRPVSKEGYLSREELYGNEICFCNSYCSTLYVLAQACRHLKNDAFFCFAYEKHATIVVATVVFRSIECGQQSCVCVCCLPLCTHFKHQSDSLPQEFFFLRKIVWMLNCRLIYIRIDSFRWASGVHLTSGIVTWIVSAFKNRKNVPAQHVRQLSSNRWTVFEVAYAISLLDTLIFRGAGISDHCFVCLTEHRSIRIFGMTAAKKIANFIFRKMFRSSKWWQTVRQRYFLKSACQKHLSEALWSTNNERKEPYAWILYLPTTACAQYGSPFWKTVLKKSVDGITRSRHIISEIPQLLS